MTYPTTPAELFDFIHERYGIGNYDEVAPSDRAWWQERGTGIAKLKAMMRRRRVNEHDVAVATEYAARHGKTIRYYPQIFELIAEAKREAASDRREQRRQDLRDAVQDAASEALEAGEDEWAYRLLSVPERDAEAALEEWRASRG